MIYYFTFNFVISIIFIAISSILLRAHMSPVTGMNFALASDEKFQPGCRDK